MTGPILVTGAAGLVGRAVTCHLSEREIPHVGLARPGGTALAGTVPIDLADRHCDLTNLTSSRPSVIIHCAAGVPLSPAADTETLATTTTAMDTVVVAAARAWNVPLVYVSTCGLYDRTAREWKYPSSPITIQSPYFAAKRAGELLALGLPQATVLRLSAPVGPGMAPGAVVARFLHQAHHTRNIEVWGQGRREQDFIAAKDVAGCLVNAALQPVPGIFNLAFGHPTSMLLLAETIAATVDGCTITVGTKPDAAEDQTARYETGPTITAFGWSPRIGLSQLVASITVSDFRP
jgi:nucleoside-diphosphate-sugar epimerase